MAKELMPWKRRRSSLPAERGEDPFYRLRKQVNDFVDDLFKGFQVAPFRGEEGFGEFHPSCDVIENDTGITIKAEMPGMDEKNIDVSLTKNSLTIKGEKKEEKEDKGKYYYRMERSYGAFHRTIPLPGGVDTEKVAASFKNGILTINLPKTPEAREEVKKISIKTEE